MINTRLLTIENIAVIGIFAIIAHIFASPLYSIVHTNTKGS